VLNADQGLVNSILGALHLPAPSWLKDAHWAKPGFILMDLWAVGGSTLIYLAALQNVPQHLHEAAELDGAGPWARFRHVTLPALSPTVFFLVITGMIWILQYFTQAFVMTKGKPENSTLFYGLYVFQNAFEYFRMGYACALAWLLFIVALLATWVVFRTSARWVYYEAEEGG
jgi:multiple sugar transport system permease protein